MTIFRILALSLMAAASIAATAQDEADERSLQWYDMSSLHYAATGGTNPTHVLQQHVLIDDAVMDANQELGQQLITFSEEFLQKQVNIAVPQAEKELDEAIARVKQTMKEHTELAATLKEGLKEMEAQRGQATAEYVKEVGDYTYAPAPLLAKVKAIAVNKRTYCAYRDLGHNMWAVMTGQAFGPLQNDAFNRPKAADGQEYTWTIINADGRSIVEPKYTDVFGHPDQGFISLYCMQGGTSKCGLIDYTGRVLIPFKYDSYWSYRDGEITMKRFDNQLDILDATTYKVKRTEPVPDEGF